jgi:hypothetical protein
MGLKPNPNYETKPHSFSLQGNIRNTFCCKPQLQLYIVKNAIYILQQIFFTEYIFQNALKVLTWCFRKVVRCFRKWYRTVCEKKE